MKLKQFSIFISLFVISVSVFSQNMAKVTLEDIWMNYSFYPERAENITPLNDDKHYVILENGIFIEKYEFKTGKKIESIARSGEILDPKSNKSIGKIDDFSFNSDETQLLIAYDETSLYRRSSESYYVVYNIKTKLTQMVFEDGKIQLAQFSPDGKNVSFIFKNNLYIKNLITNKLTQVTTDGLDRNIINGGTDWVYEEEFELTKANIWSPDGKKIAFLRFDESKVKEYSMQMWGELYPEDHKFKYPKAGEDNSVVDVLIYDTDLNKTSKLDVGSQNDQYIPRFYWVPNSSNLLIMKMNRHQSQMELIQFDYPQLSQKTIYTEENKYWVEVPELFLSNNGKEIFLSSESDGFNHIYIVEISNGIKKQLTKGKWDIEHIQGVDEIAKKIYFTSFMESSIETVLSSVTMDGKIEKLSTQKGNNSAVFSKKLGYYFNTYSSCSIPPQVNLYDNKGKLVREIITNNALKEKLEKYKLSPKEFFTIKNATGNDLDAWMIKPTNFDSNKKYPVLMFVYGGPGSKSVENQWDYFDYFWYQILADKGYIIACVDNRGTNGKGEEFKKCIYKQMGRYETEDQIDGAKYFSSLPYVDGKRIGIWGWSYGGYMSTLCITKGAAEFKTAIAVAPVTNWRYYDNIYTERFMQTPKENAKGYDDNSPINHVSKLKGNFLLIHGSADDNVHYQNSMMLLNSLVKAGKQFEMFVYPNRNHNIAGGTTRYHLYVLLTDFIERKL